MFDVQWQGRILEIRMSGFWDIAQFNRYELALVDALQSAPQGAFGLLADLTGMTTQSADIVEHHSVTTDQIKSAGASAIAVVTTSALLRRQVDRAVGEAVPVALFDTATPARVWLIDSLDKVSAG